MNKPDEMQPQDATAGMELPPSAKRLLRVVYSMGIILVLLFLILVGALIWKGVRKPKPAPIPVPAELGLNLAPDTEIRSAALDGDRLVINTGREVIVVDIRKNAVISRISLSR